MPKKQSGSKLLSKKKPKTSTLKVPSNRIIQLKAGKFNNNNKPKITSKPSSKVRTSGIGDVNFGQIISTASDVISEGVGLLSGNPGALLNLPNTILKVVDTTKSAVSSLRQDNAPKVVIQKDDISKLQNQKIINELALNVPIVNTSSLPSSTGNQISLPPLRQEEYMSHGRKILRISGAAIIGVVGFGASNAMYKAFNELLTPISSASFGIACSTICQVYQKWRCPQVSWQYIPIIGNDIPGSVHLTCLDGTNASTTPTVDDLSIREHYSPGSAKDSIQLHVKNGPEWYWLTNPASPNDEPLKFYAHQRLEIFMENNNTATGWPSAAGQVLASFVVEFTSMAEYSYSLASRVQSDLCAMWVSSYMGLDKSTHFRIIKRLLDFFIEKQEEVVSTINLNLVQKKNFKNMNKFAIQNRIQYLILKVQNDTRLRISDDLIKEININKNMKDFLFMLSKSYDFGSMIKKYVIYYLKRCLELEIVNSPHDYSIYDLSLFDILKNLKNQLSFFLHYNDPFKDLVLTSDSETDSSDSDQEMDEKAEQELIDKIVEDIDLALDDEIEKEDFKIKKESNIYKIVNKK